MPILRTQRSVTLLGGDSGIGKSTLLREVIARLTACPDMIVGFHEAPSSDRDPLLYALKNLLSKVYTVDGISTQLRIACEKLKGELSLSGLKSFLLGVLKTVSDSPGLGLLAKVAVGVFEWASDRTASLEATLPNSLLPQLGYDAFNDIYQILHTALPDKHLVLVIDNLSASADSVTADVRGFGSLDTIHDFLSQSYPTSSRIHMLFSWKLNEHTRKAFVSIANTTR